MQLMPSNLRPAPVSDPGPTCTTADRIRDAVSRRCGRVEALDRGHQALDLAALAIDALHANLSGQATTFRGPHSGDHWRQALRGEHPIAIEDLARLAVDPAREARQALRDVLAPLADAAGYDLVPRSRGLLTLAEATAQLSDAGTACLGAIARAYAPDGPGGSEITPEEDAAIEQALRRAEQCVINARAARHGPRRRVQQDGGTE